MPYLSEHSTTPAFQPEATCVGAATLILGDKWTPLLLQYLATQQPARFCHIQEAIGGINPRTLSARLSRLEAQGIVIKTVYEEMPPRTDYRLTVKGRDLLPILEMMGHWSEKYGLCLIPQLEAC